jgi:exodeoxyribonuclease VII large subunit
LTWVEGELRNLSRSRAGHVYFDLVDADHTGADATRPSLAVALFNTDRQRVNQFLAEQGGAVRMGDGIRVRVGGRLGTYAARSSLQLVMDRIDPAFTLGLLGLERTRLLAALTADGVLRANAGIPLPALPLSIALVTSDGSAAHADALDELRRSGFGFRVSFLDARTQGADAEASMVAALLTAASLGVDVIALVRGGGAATDLVAFDSETLARTIAGLGVPVITGIGHETDRSVADEVAHTAHKTPTAAAAALVGAVREARAQVHDAWVAVRSGAHGRLVRADAQLGRAGHRSGSAALRRLDRHRLAVDHQVHRLRTAAARATDADAAALDALSRRVSPATARTLERAEDGLAARAARAAVHDPTAALARGWSITRTDTGRLLRSAAEATDGATIVTTLADGAVRSTVRRANAGDQDGHQEDT